MNRIHRSLLILFLLAGLPGISRGGDRHFIYNYESGVIGNGEKELETYTTYRFGRDSYYSAMDQSIEFETGLGGNVQTSVYLNFTQTFADLGNGPQMDPGSPVLDGVSNEWKFKLSDSEADGLGLGLYLEPEFEPDNFELEFKVILDKKMESWLWTFNFLAAPAVKYVDGSTVLLLRPSLGLGYFLSERFFIGVEGMDENFYDNQPMRSVFSLGPLVEYSGNGWWVALSYLPQLANIGQNTLDFTDSQRNQIRLATSFSL